MCRRHVQHILKSFRGQSHSLTSIHNMSRGVYSLFWIHCRGSDARVKMNDDSRWGIRCGVCWNGFSDLWISFREPISTLARDPEGRRNSWSNWVLNSLCSSTKSIYIAEFWFLNDPPKRGNFFCCCLKIFLLLDLNGWHLWKFIETFNSGWKV